MSAPSPWKWKSVKAVVHNLGRGNRSPFYYLVGQERSSSLFLVLIFLWLNLCHVCGVFIALVPVHILFLGEDWCLGLLALGIIPWKEDFLPFLACSGRHQVLILVGGHLHVPYQTLPRKHRILYQPFLEPVTSFS